LHIHGSVIEKCVHGIYLADSEQCRTGIARYCGFCTPSFDSGSTKEEWEKLVRDNACLKRVFDSVSCPNCGSETHFVEGKFWKCSECSNEWRPPRGLRNSKALVSIRAC
jgi:hypothetical protein